MFISVPQARTAPTTSIEVRQRAQPARRERRADVGVATVWQSALTAFVAHAPAILLVTCVCIAGPALLCQVAAIALGLDFYSQVSGPFATWLGIGTLRGGSVNPVAMLTFIQAGLGGIGLAFARGMIARLSLSDAADAPNLRLVCREAMARLSGLLVSSLLYAACLTVGAVGINSVLSDTGFDLTQVGRRNFASPVQTLARRTLDAFVPSPGAPFAELVPALRQFTPLGPPRRSFELVYWENMSRLRYGETSVPSSSDALVTAVQSQALLTSLASLVALVLAEALLRFTPIMLMNPGGRTGPSAIRPIPRSVRLGIRHFGEISKHVWLLRLAFVACYSVFFMLPVVLCQEVAPSIVTSVTRSVMGNWSDVLVLACHSLITALFVAFCTVYDAQLVAHLDARNFRD